MPGFDHLGRGINEIIDFLITGQDTAVAAADPRDENWLKYRNEGYIYFAIPKAIRR